MQIFDCDNIIQLYSPECTLAENININNNKQNKDRNILINTVQLNISYTFVNVLTKDITEDALGKFPHEFRTPFQCYTLNIVAVKYLHTISDNL